MKKLLLFILLFNLNWFTVLACGFYPYGEDVRFSLMKPNIVFPHSSNLFFYNSQQFSFSDNPDAHYLSGKYEENLELWFDLLGGKADKESIFYAIYEATKKELKNSKSSNAAIRLLHLKENKDILNYLYFAKACSPLNGNLDDPWERDNENVKKGREKMIRKCLGRIQKTSSQKLKKRYAHLALRLAYYNRDAEKVSQYYQTYFDRDNLEDALDFWALHFKLQFDKPSPNRNIDVALVFANSPEKRFATSFFYDAQFDFSEVLAKTTTKQEKQALYFTKAIKSPIHALEDLKLAGSFGTQEKDLLFATLREINKLEDWILTPYYTNFAPSFHSSWDDEATQDALKKRIIADRFYAKNLALWISEIIESNSFQNPWWEAMKVYADFLAGGTNKLPDSVLEAKNALHSNEPTRNFLDQLYVLSKIANSKGENLSKLGLEQLVFAHKESNLFLFAAGKELEFKGNKFEAIALLSRITHDEYWSNGIYWKSANRNRTLHSDYYYDYFFYMDATFSSAELNNLIKVLNDVEEPTEFELWKNATLTKDKNRLYDLLGVLHIRKNQLPEALAAFEKVETFFWNNEHFQTYFSEDPFANNFISERNSESDDRYTKPQLVEKLIQLKSKINSSSGDEKAKYAFQVANCYRNMTYYGTAWLMRRYYWSGSHNDAGLVDDAEYRNADLAKEYYSMAYKSAKTKDFKALSLRMVGRCEKYKLFNAYESSPYEQGKYDQIFTGNKYYKQLKKEFPNEYDDLISNCASLYGYYSSIK